VRRGAFLGFFAVVCLTACQSGDGAPGLSRERKTRPRALAVGDFFPRESEAEVVGALERRVTRGSVSFSRLVKHDSRNIVFKDEERTGADRLMHPAVRMRLNELSRLVKREWPSLELRVTEAWDEDQEHGALSVHYEGRAVDVTTSDTKPERLGRLAGLAVEAGFDWVYREKTHVHASVRAKP
jgi:Hedgehog amino-terminal signalling domain